MKGHKIKKVAHLECTDFATASLEYVLDNYPTVAVFKNFTKMNAVINYDGALGANLKNFNIKQFPFYIY